MDFNRQNEVMAECSRRLQEISEYPEIGNRFLDLCACALAVDETFLGSRLSFPVDVERITERMGIRVIYQALNRNLKTEGSDRTLGRTVKIKNRLTGERIETILIDSESAPGDQRYALAHELAHCLIRRESGSHNSAYGALPLFFQDTEEMVADIFALFLLFPVPLLMEKLESYLMVRPEKFSDWMRYLSMIAEVPYERTVVGYEQFRYACGILYRRKLDETPAKDVWEEKLLNILTDSVLENLINCCGAR